MSDLKWNKRYFKLSNEIASWSKDPRTKVGAVIIGDFGQVISQGFNGFPRNIIDTYERLNSDEKNKYVVHAEANAIYNAIHNGSSTIGSAMYVTGLPICHECAKAIIQVGIKEVYYNTKSNKKWADSCNLALSILSEAGVKVTFIGNEDENL